jgi:hypothetical protein
MYTTNRSEYNTPQKLIDDYLNKGGQITVCSPGATTEGAAHTGGFYRSQKKPSGPAAPAVDDEEN